jgi:hypothetical protein
MDYTTSWKVRTIFGEGRRAVLESPSAGAWAIALHLVPQDGRVVVSELHVMPQHGKGGGAVPRGGITARLVRSIPVHRHVEEMMRQPPLRGLIERFFAKVYGAKLHAVHTTGPARIGRPRRSMGVLLEVAAAYAKAVAAQRPNPVQTTARQLGITPVRARDLVHESRVRGLLARVPVSGVAGGSLTPEAAAMLKARTKPKSPRRSPRTKRRR